MEQHPGILLKLSPDLHYLIGPALHYGKHQWDHEIFDFLDHATETEMGELAALAERVLWNDDYPRVLAFLHEHPITEAHEAACLYNLFGVMDYADLQFDRVPEE
jgi:hypothetical protein